LSERHTKAVWIVMTTKMTIARAKLETWGAGSPSGFLSSAMLTEGWTHHAMKHKIEATKRIVPKPPKTYESHLIVSSARSQVPDSLEEDIGTMRSDLIRSILLQSPCSDLGIEPDFLADIESLEGFIPGQEVPLEVGYFFDVVFVDGRGRPLL
jgi:hypothetical protein